ncbi:MAG: hypothetical protein F6J93_40110 [Oscillatoria sp. SIO1A7]|nr:hypothetical protein [Oscillatoria sp. SIO1A7]
MEALILAYLLRYLKEAAVEYIIELIKDLLTFEKVNHVHILPQYPGGFLLKTSEIIITRSNLQGTYKINRNDHEHRKDSKSVDVNDSSREFGEIHLFFPLFTSYVKWEAKEEPSNANVKQFRAYPQLHKLGSIYLESLFSEISNLPFLSEPVYFNRSQSISKFSDSWPGDFKGSFLNERIFLFSSASSFHRTIDTIFEDKNFISALWDLEETIHYSVEVPGKITTYGWPAALGIFAHNDPPPNPPELPEGSLG